MGLVTLLVQGLLLGILLMPSASSPKLVSLLGANLGAFFLWAGGRGGEHVVFSIPSHAPRLRDAHAETGKGKALIKVGSVSISPVFSEGLSDVPAALLLGVMFSGFSCTGVIGNNLKYILGDGY